MPHTTEAIPTSRTVVVGGLFAAFLGVDLATESFPILVAYVLILAWSASRLPVGMTVTFFLLATAVPGVEPFFQGEQFTMVSLLLAVLNRGSVLGGVLFLAWKFAINRSREYVQSRHDELTGLPNRRFFLERMEAEINRSRRTRKPLTVAFLDGDKFKTVNDAHGHAAGDRVLQTIARSLSANIRDYDVAARWGGDEFVLLFPETDADQARLAASRLLALLEQEVQSAGNPLTFSVGVVTDTALDHSAEDLIRQADKAMYAAKQSPQIKVSFVVLHAEPVGASPH